MPSDENNKPFQLCAITDRHSLPGGESQMESFLARAIEAGIDMIQIREKDLPDGELLSLTRLAVELARGSSTQIIVNDRLDVALAAGAVGVHLGGRSAPTSAIREMTPDGFVIGVSTHNPGEVEMAVSGGADFIVFGPVFYTPSKAKYGPPVGLAALEQACKLAPLPVLPLGGIKSENYSELLDYPVAGLAAISLFQGAGDLAALVERIRQNAEARG